MHMIHKTFPTYEYDYTDNFETQFGPLPEVVSYDTHFVDPQSGLDPYSDGDLYDQDKLEYKDTYNNLMTKLKVMTYLRMHMYQTHYDMH